MIMLTRMDKPFVFFANLVYEPCPLSVTIDRDTWYVYSRSSEDPGKNGFYGCSYIFTNSNPPKMTIAFRGTDSKWDLYSDFFVALGKVPQNWLSETMPFVSNTLSNVLIDYPNIAITFAGHSLGSVYGELSAVYWKKPAVSVESPGSLQAMQELITWGIITPDSINFAANNVFAYNAQLNAITSTQDHVGMIYRVYPSYDFNKPVCSYDISPSYFFTTFTFQQHQVVKILDLFTNQNKPEVYRPVPAIGWPGVGLTGSLNEWLNFNNNPYYWTQMIEASHSICDPDVPFEQYKQIYMHSLRFNSNPYERIGHVIYALGKSGSYTTIFGTTSGKDQINFEDNAFNVIAFGFNQYYLNILMFNDIYIFQQDSDENRESKIFLTNYNCYLGGLAINNVLQLPAACRTILDQSFTRVDNTQHPNNYDIRIGPVRITNSPLGQYNIIPASRSNFIYKGVIPPTRIEFASGVVAASKQEVNLLFTWLRTAPQHYRYDLDGNFIANETIAYPGHCNINSFKFLVAYEQNNNMNVWSTCNINEGPYSSFINLNGNPFLQCSMAFPCFRAPNFNVNATCTTNPNLCPSDYEIMLPNMTYITKSGTKIMLKNSQFPYVNSNIAILDSQNNNIFNGDFTIRDSINCYRLFYPGEISSDENMRFMLTDCLRTYEAPQIFTIETKALQYIHSITAINDKLISNTTISSSEKLPVNFIANNWESKEKYALTLYETQINQLVNQLSQIAHQAVWDGALRGSAQVIEDSMRQVGYSAEASYYVKQISYYGCYFTFSLANHLGNDPVQFNANEVEQLSATIALYNAAVDTGFLFIANKGLEQARNIVNWVGDKFSEQGFKQTGRFFKSASHLLGAGIYARDAMQQGTSKTVTRVAVGMVTENIVRQAGNKLFSLFKPQSKLTSETYNQVNVKNGLSV